MLVTHFYSDPHFGHRNIIEYTERPFKNVADMEKGFIERYNDTVKDDSVVFWLGDAFLCPVEMAEKIMAKLRGRKLIIVGNHDKPKSTLLKLGFEVALDEAVMRVADRTCRLSHYPYAGANYGPQGRKDERYLDRRPKKIKGELLIHGHSHYKKRSKETMIHIGVDAWDYKPVSIEDVEALIKRHL